MKFVDKTNNDGPVVEIGEKGSWDTSSSAEIGYYFDGEHVSINIDGYFFGQKTLDELIAFLEFAKTKVME